MSCPARALPSSIVLEILLTMDVHDLVRCARVCRAWHDLFGDAFLWRSLLRRDFEIQSTPESSAAQLRTEYARAFKEVTMEIEIDGQIVGNLHFELFDHTVPLTCLNFRRLCRFKFNSCLFHRIIPHFMAQGGDFERRDGTGGYSMLDREHCIDTGARLKFRDENFIEKHSQYALSMANSGPNTNCSQFFVTFSECPWLNEKHVVFGRAVRCEAVLRLMENTGSNSGKTRVPVAVRRCWVDGRCSA
eukprot:gnl/Spiro4/17489_TR9307_c0_g1_i1.p1 gnl/Spiro4/17489_TR9307_c0_g1~~gnl/Spiro4/17489_TR9307_c0_g1_i1.p1  ORF type:complete len:246 (-),score=47.39 gnl/Spiro4/17489_TR9307_c0_g1_i1:70-807(-)